MTDKELRELVASLAASQKQASADLAASQKQASADLAASRKQASADLAAFRKQVSADLAASQKQASADIKELRAAQRETDWQLRKIGQLLEGTIEETDRRIEENDRRIEETDRQIKELGRQIGGLGRKFGGLTEGMAYPSMKKLLRERFGMEFVVPRVEITRHGQSMELDVFGYSNGKENRAVVVEVKSRLDEPGIEQMERIMARFDEFLPEHRDKQRFGIVAAVDYSPEMEDQVYQRGFYLARIQDELFVLDSPESFRPRYFGNGSHTATP